MDIEDSLAMILLPHDFGRESGLTDSHSDQSK